MPHHHGVPVPIDIPGIVVANNIASFQMDTNDAKQYNSIQKNLRGQWQT